MAVGAASAELMVPGRFRSTVWSMCASVAGLIIKVMLISISMVLATVIGVFGLVALIAGAVASAMLDDGL